MSDKVAAIRGIVSSYFTDGEYTPYYAAISETIAIVTYFIEGLEFEENESVYECSIRDDEVKELIDEFYTGNGRAKLTMDFVKKQVEDIVEFEKEEMIHSHPNMDKIIEACNVIIDSLDNFSKLNITELNKDNMETGLKVMRQLAEKDFTLEDISKAIKNAVGFDMDDTTAKIIDYKNSEIERYKKLLAEK